MNKKGFISISSVYAFFLVFLLLLLFTVNGMVSNRVMINNIKNEVKEEISTSTSIPIIESINYSVTNNSITVNVSASTSEGTITKYYYSKDNGVNYVSSSNSSYTFAGLVSNKTYSIFIYVENSLNKKSNVSIVKPTTSEYVNPSVTSLSVSGNTASSITLKVTASGGTNNVKTYYYSKNNGSSYVSSTSSSYTFSGLSYGTTYNFKVYVKDTAGYSSNTKSISATTLSPSFANVCSNGDILATCIKNYYNLYGSDITNIYYHTGSLANSAGDNSYRYAGANPDNYVCFGSTSSTCPSDNLYRIIGVFDGQIKLIKSEINDYYVWDTSDNVWKNSDIKLTLNSTFYNALTTTWQNKIATHTWKVGGMERNDESTAKEYYDRELGSLSSSTTDNVKIGLMYVSDYGFAALPSAWTTPLYDYGSSEVESNNWLFTHNTEYIISRVSTKTNYVFLLKYSGDMISGVVDIKDGIRPSFYMNSNITYSSGSGTKSSPIRIN